MRRRFRVDLAGSSNAGKAYAAWLEQPVVRKPKKVHYFTLAFGIKVEITEEEALKLDINLVIKEEL